MLVVEGDFLSEDGEVAAGVAGFAAGGIDHEEEEGAAEEMAEEFVTEADVFVCSFDEAGDIGDDDAAVLREFDDTDHGVEGGEGVGSDLRAGGAQSGEEGAFAGVGEADESGVGDLAEFEIEVASFAGGAFGELVGDAVGGCFEVVVAFAAAAAAAEGEFLTDFGEVGDEFEFPAGVDAFLEGASHLGGFVVVFFVIGEEVGGGFCCAGVGRAVAVDQRALGYGHDEVASAASAAEAVRALGSVFGFEVWVVEELAEVVGMGIDLEDDVAAFAAVAAVRASAGDEFFAAEADRSVAAVAGLGEDADVIDEHGRWGGGEAGPVCSGGLGSAGEGDEAFHGEAEGEEDEFDRACEGFEDGAEDGEDGIDEASDAAVIGVEEGEEGDDDDADEFLP